MLVAFGLAALLIAGVLSYLADSSSDGLDSVAQRGCTATVQGQLAGDCMARNARENPLAGGPLTGYAVGGHRGLTGVAGILGVLATVMLAGGVFWLLRRRAPSKTAPSEAAPSEAG